MRPKTSYIVIPAIVVWGNVKLRVACALKGFGKALKAISVGNSGSNGDTGV